MASKTPQASKEPAKVDPGEANTPARNRQPALRRRTPQARSKSTATQTGSAAQEAAVALEGASEGVELSKNSTLSPQHQASQFEPISEGAALATANAPSADRPLASTKRAIAGANCALGPIHRVYSKSVPKDRVIAQTPAAGARLAESSRVNVTVSRGKKRR